MKAQKAHKAKIVLIACMVIIALACTQAYAETSHYPGYNLFSPKGSKVAYLMDNYGNCIHSWTGDYGTSCSVYLLEDGSILWTTSAANSRFNAGGFSGRIVRYSWEGELLWNFEHNTSEYMLHHDIEMMPNGNILMIAWELKTESEAIAAGRNPSRLNGELWPDYIIEVAPDGPDGGNIVWEWHLWDHLIQDFDETKDNYGVVKDHPEKVNINFPRNSQADWVHSNGIDYNADLDQIVISSRTFCELWIIDHSTTTGEAAGSTGGNAGKGGDLLYRWGNPQAYDRGTASDKTLFYQHDAEWIEAGFPGEGDILIYNNGDRRADGNYSSVDQITPPLQKGSYTYTIESDSAYGPETLTWTYFSDSDFYSSLISGSQRLANGNTLICEGNSGHFFEVTEDGTVVWEYDYGSNVFRVDRYSPDYAGFSKAKASIEKKEGGGGPGGGGNRGRGMPGGNRGGGMPGGNRGNGIQGGSGEESMPPS